VSELVLDGVTAGYGGATVLHGIDLQVGRGEIVVLLGANGAGKTTLLRAISRLIDLRGSARFDGVELRGLSAERVVRLGISHVPEGRGTFPDLTVEENLRAAAYPVRRAARRAAAERLERCFALFPRLAERRSQAAGSLSGGEQQMLAVCRGLVPGPRLLLLDEPSAGLAPRVTQELFAVLPQLAAEFGLSLLLVEQNARLALRIADRVSILETGSIVRSGDAASIGVDDDVRRSYLGY